MQIAKENRPYLNFITNNKFKLRTKRCYYWKYNCLNAFTCSTKINTSKSTLSNLIILMKVVCCSKQLLQGIHFPWITPTVLLLGNPGTTKKKKTNKQIYQK